MMRAHVFPGQGVQKKGMGADVLQAYPDLCRQADGVLGYSVAELCRDDPRRPLTRTEYAQPAIFVVNALHHLEARRQGCPDPDYVAGHSLGEYNALFAAGAFDFTTGVTLVKRRGELMGKADEGGMAAVVGLPLQVLQGALQTEEGAGIVIANYNGPDQFVLSGRKDELARLEPLIQHMEGLIAFVPLRVSGAFHSPLMEEAGQEFRTLLDSVDFAQLHTPVVSSVTGWPIGTDDHAVRTALAEQITRPVRWDECARFLLDVGVEDVLELGGTNVLTSMIDKVRAGEGGARGPWREYRDERLLAVLAECANGRLSLATTIATIRSRDGITV